MQFTPQQLTEFLEVSKDNNPLHLDEHYARRTAYGKPVVYGVLAVLKALQHWTQGRETSLSFLSVQFKRPLYTGVEYSISISGGPETVLQILRGNTVQTVIRLSTEERKKVPKLTLGDEPAFEKDSINYAPGRDPKALFSFLPPTQVSSLLWASQFVGTEFPGTQALFSSLEFHFDRTQSSSSSLELKGVVGAEDDRFGLFTVKGSGTGLKAFTLQALKRPEAVQYSLKDIRSHMGAAKRFQKRTVFVSGASRGFGAVLARSFALEGANIYLNYFKNESEAQEIATDIRSAGSEVTLLQGDCANKNACEGFRHTVSENGNLDFLILNATPTIRPLYFLEQTPEEFMAFITSSLELVSTLCHSLLPAMKDGGTVLTISSVFTQKAEAQFSHYIAAKSAIEGLMRALAVEFPKLHFRTIRPSKMRTDQTTHAGLPEDLISPVDVALDVLDALAPSGPGEAHANC